MRLLGNDLADLGFELFDQTYIYCPQKVGDIGIYKNLEIQILICRINNFVFGYSNM